MANGSVREYIRTDNVYTGVERRKSIASASSSTATNSSRSTASTEAETDTAQTNSTTRPAHTVGTKLFGVFRGMTKKEDGSPKHLTVTAFLTITGIIIGILTTTIPPIVNFFIRVALDQEKIERYHTEDKEAIKAVDGKVEKVGENVTRIVDWLDRKVDTPKKH